MECAKSRQKIRVVILLYQESNADEMALAVAFTIRSVNGYRLLHSNPLDMSLTALKNIIFFTSVVVSITVVKKHRYGRCESFVI